MLPAIKRTIAKCTFEESTLESYFRVSGICAVRFRRSFHNATHSAFLVPKIDVLEQRIFRFEGSEIFECFVVSRDLALTSATRQSHFELHPELHRAANCGLEIFPVPESARLTGQPERLIGEATSDISLLKELASEYTPCSWRVALGLSKLCALRVDGALGRASLAALSLDEDDSLTLRAQRGDTVWAFFRYPVGLTLRSSAKKLAPGVSVLASGESCPIPPSAGGTWLNSWAEIEAVPSWLRELAFESPNTPPGEAIAVRTPSPRPAPCRSAQRFEKQHRCVRNGYPNFNQGGGRRGFRPSRRS